MKIFKSSIIKKLFLWMVFFLLFNLLLASNSKKLVLSVGEKKILKNLRITPANFWLKANDFTAEMSDGRRIRLKDFQGRFVLLNFWATWCHPCVKEMPDLEKAFQSIGEEKLIILAVAMGENVERVKRFSKKNSFTFPLLSDEDLKITKLYGVKSIPVTYLIDPEGIVLGRALGIRNWSSPELIVFIKSRLKKN